MYSLGLMAQKTGNFLYNIDFIIDNVMFSKSWDLNALVDGGNDNSNGFEIIAKFLQS